MSTPEYKVGDRVVIVECPEGVGKGDFYNGGWVSAGVKGSICHLPTLSDNFIVEMDNDQVFYLNPKCFKHETPEITLTDGQVDGLRHCIDIIEYMGTFGSNGSSFRLDAHTAVSLIKNIIHTEPEPPKPYMWLGSDAE